MGSFTCTLCNLGFTVTLFWCLYGTLAHLMLAKNWKWQDVYDNNNNSYFLKWPLLFIIVLSSGVGRLIAEAKVTPIVIPFWHEGNYIPSFPSFFIN